jgi:hypothetical protein
MAGKYYKYLVRWVEVKAVLCIAYNNQKIRFTMSMMRVATAGPIIWQRCTFWRAARRQGVLVIWINWFRVIRFTLDLLWSCHGRWRVLEAPAVVVM